MTIYYAYEMEFCDKMHMALGGFGKENLSFGSWRFSVLDRIWSFIIKLSFLKKSQF